MLAIKKLYVQKMNVAEMGEMGVSVRS